MRKDRAYLQDILEATNSIEDFLKGKSKKEFFKSDLLQSGVVRKLEIIGEATKNISKELKSKHKDVDWRSASGMRDILIHHYFGITVERVWETVKNHLPLFKQQISEIFKEIEREENNV